MGLMMAFLKWICNNYLAKRNGEKAKKKKTLNQYWRDFKMLFRRVNSGTLVDPDVSTEVVKVCRPLLGRSTSEGYVLKSITLVL
jgi:hypothetical protein